MKQPNSEAGQDYLACIADVRIEAGAEKDGKTPLPRFSMVAYTGAPMRVGGWRYPVVVDLSGMEIPSQNLPIRFGHDSGQGVGHTDSIRVEDGKLIAAGFISRETAAAREVAASARNGFPWQASIGAGVEQHEFIEVGASSIVNGKAISGPANVVRKSVLSEISFVDLGADRNTSASVAALANDSIQSQEENEVEKKAEQQGAVPVVAADPVAEMRAKAAAEAQRIAAVQTKAAKHPQIVAKAIAEGWDETRTELEVVRAERAPVPAPVSGSAQAVEAEVLEAAICAAGKLHGLEKKFSEKTLDAAHRVFKGKLGLQDLLIQAARGNGYSGFSFRSDMEGVLRAAFSTFTLPGIMSNVANKFLLDAFNAVESAWREIAGTRNVQDFKQVTSYRLTGGFEYEEVGPGGELKHATLGEMSYTNQVKTYGKIFGLTRQDLINDDLGALTDLPRRLGRGAATKLNDVFWKAFLNNAAFFSAANKNYLAGIDTAMSIDGLTKAEQLFLDQTDPDGYSLGALPRILLVPNALNTLASQLMQATEIRDNDAASRKYPVTNPHAGKFRTVRSSYLSSAKYPGNSTKAWYLLADPADLPVIEVAFLNGQQTPTIESTDADFDQLGIRFRGYHDFGVNLQEPRGGVKLKGEA